jgi:23S rRNA-/tRNA-specific pseudouridylate synthase
MRRTLIVFSLTFVVYPIWSMTTQDSFFRLSRALRCLYLKEGTTGILRRLSRGVEPANIDVTNEDYYFLTTAPKLTPREWISISLDAARGDKGMASGLLNARLGSFVSEISADNPKGAAIVSFMEAYDSLDSSIPLKPDLVTLCLAYTALRSYDIDTANRYLQRAIEFSPHTSAPLAMSSQGLCHSWEELEHRYDIRLLHQEDEFLILSKPSGMVCYHEGNVSKRHTQSNRNLSLEDCLYHHFKIPLSTLNAHGKGLVHRIDRGTSGCILVAKTNAAHAVLLSQFFLRRVQKSYHAIVVTESAMDRRFDVHQEGRTSIPIDGRRPSESHFVVQERLSSCSSRLVKLRIHTEQGRKHQVRIHCSKGWKAPILLDPLYGGRQIMSQFPSSCLQRFYSEHKFCLHASTLTIPEYNIHVEDPQPAWWQEVETELKLRNACQRKI